MNQPKRPWIVEHRPGCKFGQTPMSWSWRCSVSTREAALKRMDGVLALEQGEVRIRHRWGWGEEAWAASSVDWEAYKDSYRTPPGVNRLH